MNGEGERLIANTDSNGRFHSDWLSMMYPRLRLARTLLAEDGGYFYQSMIMEIYNAEEFVMLFSVHKIADNFYIKVRHENRILEDDIDYQLVIEVLLCYSRSKVYCPSQRKHKAKNDYRYDIHIFGECSERRCKSMAMKSKFIPKILIKF